MQTDTPERAHTLRFAWVALGLGLLAALPSLGWGLLGAGYLSDDFGVANGFTRRGLLQGSWDLAFVAPRRPGTAPYYLVIYQLVGQHPFAQALILAALNALVVILVWLALRRIVNRHTALFGALLLAVVPNRGATRMWFVLGPNLVATACLAAAVILMLRDERLLLASVVLLVGVLSYEGIVGLALLGIAWWWVRHPRQRLRWAIWYSGLIGSAALTMWWFSPKQDVAGPGPFHHAGTLAAGVLGEGFWGEQTVGAIASLAVVLLVGVCAARLLPSLRPADTRVRDEVLMGACMVVAGSLPLLVGGAPFAVRGIFDRNNLVPDLGACLILGAALAAVSRAQRLVGGIVALTVIVGLAVGNLQDVRDYHAAVHAGHQLERALLADVDPRIGVVVVTPPFDGTTGVDPFILSGDLTEAMELRHGSAWQSVHMPGLLDDCRATVLRAGATGSRVFIYDRLDRTLRRASGVDGCAP